MRNVVLFDFDETLILENSLMSLFGYYCDRKKIFGYSFLSIFDKRFYTRQYKKAVKCTLYQNILAGQPEESLSIAGSSIANSLTPIRNVVEDLHAYADLGNEVWIITATPELFVRGIIKSFGWPVTKVIGTRMNSNSGILEGNFEKECEWGEKVERLVAEVQNLEDPVSFHASYGNLPQDQKIISVAKHHFHVKNGFLSQIYLGE
ncbi:haloacid dehalogenase-like hydrolase [Vibrio sp. PNB22_4_1]